MAYPPGQSTDIATRYFAGKLAAALGQPVVVENRAGAFGNIGTAYAARTAPDGYNLLMGASGTHALNPALYDDIGYDAEKDFEPIAATALIPMVVSVSPKLEVDSLAGLFQLARSRPDKVDVALPSVTAQLVFEMMKLNGVPLYAVRYKGSGEAMAALLGDQVPVLIDTVAASRAQFDRIRPLAVTSLRAMSALPDLRPVSEQGLEKFNVVAWNVLMAPRGIPPEVRSRLADEMQKILALPETRETLHKLGFEPAPWMERAELVEWLRSERQSNADVVRAANMKAQ